MRLRGYFGRKSGREQERKGNVGLTIILWFTSTGKVASTVPNSVHLLLNIQPGKYVDSWTNPGGRMTIQTITIQRHISIDTRYSCSRSQLDWSQI